MTVEGLGFPVQAALVFLIALLNLYGPFVLLFFLPVPFYILLTLFIRKLSTENKTVSSPLIIRNAFIRGPPATLISR